MRENENTFILLIPTIERVLNLVSVNYLCGKTRRDPLQSYCCLVLKYYCKVFWTFRYMYIF